MRKLSKKIWNKRLALALVGALGVAVLGGCGNDTASTDESTAAESAESGAEDTGDVEVIKVGTYNAYVPYCYLDDDGNPTGYEIEVLQKIDELLPQYEFDIEATADDTLGGLLAGKYRISSCQWEYTEERAQTYLFANESIDIYETYIAVPVENDTIKSIDDLKGKTIQSGGETGATYSILYNYNQEHPDKAVELNTSASTTDEMIGGLLNGAWDATAANINDLARINEQYGENGEDVIKLVGDPINATHAYFLYNPKDEQLRDDVDGALKQLKEDGTLSELAVKWLGEDFSSPLGE